MFVLQFDVETGINWLYPVSMLVGWLVISATFVVLLVHLNCVREWGNFLLVTLLFVASIGLGGFVIPVQFFERWQAVHCAQDGDYEEVEGAVKDYQHSMTSPNWSASYTVGGVSFRSSNNPFNGCETPGVGPDGPESVQAPTSESPTTTGGFCAWTFGSNVVPQTWRAF